MRLMQSEKGHVLALRADHAAHAAADGRRSEDVDLGGWKMIIGGVGAPARAGAEPRCERGIDVFAGYGMSETCPLARRSRSFRPVQPGMPTRRAASMRCTRPASQCPRRSARRRRGHARRAARWQDAAARSSCARPGSTQGYFKNPQASEQLWAAAICTPRTSRYIDTDGYVQITDRIKDVIKTGGEWVSSLEIEDMISQHPAVTESAVIGMPDDKWGERALALVVLKPGQAESVTPDDIKAHIKGFVDKGVISNFAVPDRVQFVDAIEKTSVGKLDKKLLRVKYAQQAKD